MTKLRHLKRAERRLAKRQLALADKRNAELRAWVAGLETFAAYTAAFASLARVWWSDWIVASKRGSSPQ